VFHQLHHVIDDMEPCLACPALELGLSSFRLDFGMNGLTCGCKLGERKEVYKLERGPLRSVNVPAWITSDIAFIIPSQTLFILFQPFMNCVCCLDKARRSRSVFQNPIRCTDPSGTPSQSRHNKMPIFRTQYTGRIKIKYGI
jgi:hypothetical protein